MKKLLVVLAVLAVLAGGAFGYYKYLQSQVMANLEQQLIPALKEQYKMVYGREPEISYGSAKMEGRRISFNDVVFEDKGIDLSARVEKKSATLLGWDWIWDDYRCSVSAGAAQVSYGETNLTLTKGECPELVLTPDGSSGAFRRLLISGIKLTDSFGHKTRDGKPEPQTLEIGDLKIGQGSWQWEPGGKYYADAAQVEAGVADGITVTLDSLVSEAHYPQNEPSPPGWPISTSQGRIKQTKVTLKGKPLLSLEELSTENQITASGLSHKSALKGLLLPKGALSGMGEPVSLSDVELSANAELGLDYDREKGLLDLKSLSFKAKDMCDIDLGFKAGGVEISSLYVNQMDQKDLERILDQAGLADLRFHYKDKSLAQKLLKKLAEQQGSSPESLKANAQMLLMFAYSFFGRDSKGAELVDGVIKFVKDPKELCLTAKPKAPVSLKMLQKQAGDPNRIVELLNLQIKCD